MVRKSRIPRKRRLAAVRADQPDGKISQRDVAWRAGISLDRYWRIENGYERPTPEEKERIAAVLGVGVRSLAFADTLARRAS